MRARLHDLLPRGEAERTRALPWLSRPALHNDGGDPDGGGGDDPADDDPDPNDTGDPDDDDADDEGEDDPAKLKELLATAQAKLKRANARLAKRSKPVDKPKDAPDDDTKAATERAVAAERRAVRGAGAAALIEAGVTDAGSRKLLLGQLPQLADVEWDGDDPDLEDWVDQLQEDYPALFKPAKPTGPPERRQRGSVDQGAGTAPPAKKQLSYGEQLMAAATGGRRGRGR